MGKFILGLIIPIIILIIIFIISTKKKTPVVNQQKTGNGTQTATTPVSPSTQNAKPAKTKTKLKSWSTIMEVVGAFILWIAIIVGIIVGIRYLQNHPIFKKTTQETEVVRGKNNTLPDSYVEYHVLKKGEVVRVNVPDGYKCDYFGGGKKYYHQAQNSEKEIWGGNSKCPTGLGNPNAKYADISYYNEEITVVCEFKRIH